MLTFKTLGVLTLSALVSSLIVTVPASAETSGTTATAAAATATLEHLQDAFNGESNASARYIAFAKKADSEGYASVASLFRAAARAEDIHAANHAVVIRQLGATPQKMVKTPDVKATAENLKAAVAGETYERDTMYPQFLKDARAAGNVEAVRTFNLAMSAEAEHAKLYTDASGRLPSLKGASAATYYVCSVCGFTTTKLDFSKCPACFSPKDKYVTVA